MKLLRLTLAVARRGPRARAAGVRRRRRATSRPAPSPSSTAPRSRGRSSTRSSRSAKKSYEAQKQDFPKVGTPEYQNVQNAVRRVPRPARAVRAGGGGARHRGHREGRRQGGRGLRQGPLQGQARRSSRRRSRSRASRWRPSARRSARSVLAQKLFDAVTKDVKVPGREVARSTTSRTRRSTGRPSRATSGTSSSPRRRKADDEVDFAKSKAEADRSTPSCRTARDFAALAKAELRRSDGRRPNGGKLTITRGQTVPEFDKSSFELEEGEISQPVKTTLRLPHHPGALARAEGDGHAARQGAGLDQGDAAPGEAGRRHDRVGRGPREASTRARSATRRASSRPSCRRRPTPRPTTEPSSVSVDGPRGGAPRPPGADAAPSPGLPVGPRADRADDRAAHGRGGVRGRGRGGRRRRGGAPRRARRPPLPGLLPRPAPRGARASGDLESVARDVHEKLVRRHPHVFGDAEARTAGRVRERWEEIKTEQEGREGIFHHVPESLPALLQARKVQRRAAAVGYDWPDLEGPLAKLHEELARAGEARRRGGRARARDRARPGRLPRARRPPLHRRQRRAPAERRPGARAARDDAALRRAGRAGGGARGRRRRGLARARPRGAGRASTSARRRSAA